MTRDSTGPMTPRAARAMPLLLVAMLFVGFSLSACTLVKTASKVAHDVEGNKSTIAVTTNAGATMIAAQTERRIR